MQADVEREYGIIYLGASRFPYKPDLDKPSFAGSKVAMQSVLTPDYLLTERVATLDLFETKFNQADIVERVDEFLSQRPGVTDLIIYYCGHGGFLPGPAFYLTLASTREGREAGTGLILRYFRLDLERRLLSKRIYLILDCCYAAAAVDDWMSDGVGEVIANDLEASFPPSGTALLAAASRKAPALAPEEREVTLFTWHLVEAIRAGSHDARDQLSFSDLAGAVYRRIKCEPPSRQVMPQLHVPRQQEGDLSRVPFIKNKGFVKPTPKAISLSWAPTNLRIEMSSMMHVTPLFGMGARNPSPPAPTDGTVAQGANTPVSPPTAQVAEKQPQVSEQAATPRQAPQPAQAQEKRAQPSEQPALLEQAHPADQIAGESKSGARFAQRELVEKLSQTLRAWRIRDLLGRGRVARVASAVPLFLLLIGFAYLSSYLTPPIHHVGSDKSIIAQGPSMSTGGLPSSAGRGSPPAGPASSTPPVRTAAYCGSTSGGSMPPALGGPATPADIKIVPNVTTAQPLRTVAVNADQKLIAVGGDDGVVRVWDSDAFKLQAKWRYHSAAVSSVAFASRGTQALLASAGFDGVVDVVDARTEKQVARFEVADTRSNKQHAVAFYPPSNPQFVYSAGEDGLVRVWDLNNPQAEPKKYAGAGSNGAALRSLDVSPSKSRDFVAGDWDGNLTFFSEGKKPDATKGFSRIVLRAAYSPDGKFVLAGGRDAPGRNLRLWAADTHNLVRSIDTQMAYVVSVAWSGDGGKLAAGGGPREKDNVIRIWDIRGGGLAVLSGHHGDIEAITFSGDRIISVSEDKTLRVWDYANERLLLTAVPYADAYLTFTPDGCYSGPPDVESRFQIVVNGQEQAMSDQLKNALYNPNGFSVFTGR